MYIYVNNYLLMKSIIVTKRVFMMHFERKFDNFQSI